MNAVALLLVVAIVHGVAVAQEDHPPGERYQRPVYISLEQARAEALEVAHRVVPAEPARPRDLRVLARGGIDRATIQRKLQHAGRRLDGCYARFALSEATFGGTRDEQVDTWFLVAADGAVRDVQATGLAPPVAACVAEVIRGIRFPRSSDGSATQGAAVVPLAAVR